MCDYLDNAYVEALDNLGVTEDQICELVITEIHIPIEEQLTRGFDHEMTNFQEEVEQEKALHETCQRERDKLSSDKYNLQCTINEKDYEIEQLKKKVQHLDEEINEIGVTGKVDNELVNVKRQYREYEAKVQDQEEELDEQAGKIQQLEQAKMKVEMACLRERQQYQRDIDAKDEEIEKVKQDCTRKVRAMEEQVDEEMKRKEEIVKAKRDLEKRVFDLEASVDEVDNKGVERKLRKELKRVKILYKDAKSAQETQIPKSENADLKSLRNQLDDAEFAKHMALKAKTQVEADMEELQNQIDSLTQGKEVCDAKNLSMLRENGDMQLRLDELEDEMEEVIRSNKQLLHQLSEVQNNMIEVKEVNRSLDEEKITLVEKVNTLSKKLEAAEYNKVEKTELEKLDVKIQGLELKVENEAATRIKQEHQIHRLKNQLERSQEECNNMEQSQTSHQLTTSKHERMLKDCRNELETVKSLEAVHKRKKEEAENHVLNLEEEVQRQKSHINISDRRIRELQAALERGGGTSDDDDDTFLDDMSGSDESYISPVRRSSSISKRRSFSNRTNSMPVSTYRSQRGSITEDSYTPSNGYLSREGSRSSYSRQYTRSSSKYTSRQDSFEEP